LFTANCTINKTKSTKLIPCQNLTGSRCINGRFELADGATIFLDEVGEIPLQLQITPSIARTTI
jgi:hypothetical protein